MGAFIQRKTVCFSVFFPLLTSDHDYESWVMTEREQPQVQAEKIGYLVSVLSMQFATKRLAVKS